MDNSDFKEFAWQQAKDLEGWCDQGRFNLLMDLVMEHQPKSIVELGVFGGRSLVALVAAARLYGGDVVGIDPWTTEANLEGEPNEFKGYWLSQDLNAVYLKFVKSIRELGLGGYCQHIRARGEEVLDFFADGSIGLFSLDGNHAELTSCRDVHQWLPKIALGGYLVMDDTNWATMQKAVGMVKDAGFQVVHDSGHWMAFRR